MDGMTGPRKAVSIVGARPQFIKLAPLSRELRRGWHEVVVHTGQHYSANMSDILFKDLDIPVPDYNLGVGSESHGAQTGKMLAAIEAILLAEKPDVVVVFGDTNSTLAGALAAVKMGILCAHVEAGLRSFNRSMPEEINRIVADHTCDLLFAPTQTAMDNLQSEGLGERSLLTGDIMVDTLEENRERAGQRSQILSQLNLRPREYTVVTLHRPYNVDDPAYTPMLLEKLTQTGDRVVFPAHPRTTAVMSRAGTKPPPGVTMIEPLGYLDFLQLQANAARIVTDSGGIQKEAYLLGVPCITVRPETEWVETVESGWNILADPRSSDFVERLNTFCPEGARPPVFGAGVADRTVQELRRLLESRP